MSYAADYPDNYANLTQDERENRAVIGSDQCIIDGKEFYIRGCLEIPLHGTHEIFLWGVWASLWEEDFDTISEHWETANRESLIGPFKGRLANSLSLYPETANLKMTLRIMPVGARPVFMIDEQEHPLALEQAHGISVETAKDHSCRLLHEATHQ